MKDRNDLVGKTISGIIAAPGHEGSPNRIWMLQFTDGTHVEFVSPSARRTLERITNARGRRGRAGTEQAMVSPQLALNVA
ncbi:hypothetical protein F3N42_02100 [Marinihelvus fidelis]|uniref:Uncharacterized protein n=1 Tax=Marinihelvus fidelis TaxID=2613842 RepID=A0A5N0TDT4_9GAMM|nr:hypothetical protein [Marinihelvus fidelis]KAA9133175.1 hypothetical protein F3N42_02100 [Marinihelvus fidelis]